MCKETIKNELDSLTMNQIWELVDLPKVSQLSVSGSSKVKQD